jgi:DNA-binding transcriptional ArsR family regulator
MSMVAIAALIAEPSRARMLQALLGGVALTAGELAREAGIAPSSASAHIAALEAGGLVRVTKQGRHRHVRLADEHVAHLLEHLQAMTPMRRWPHGERLRQARSCYDHLAGVLGVALYDALVAQRWIAPAAGGWACTPAGEAGLEAAGIDVAAARGKQRRFACDCTDWSERRNHLAGSLAAAICAHCLAQNWLVRAGTEGLERRTLLPTPQGLRRLREAFGVELRPRAVA